MAITPPHILSWILVFNGSLLAAVAARAWHRGRWWMACFYTAVWYGLTVGGMLLLEK